MAKDSAFDVSLKSFIEQLEANEKKLAEKIEVSGIAIWNVRRKKSFLFF